MEQRTAGSNPSDNPDPPLLPIKHPPPPPATPDNRDDPLVPPPHPPPPPPPPPPPHSSPLTSSHPHKPATQNETYVIQVPKDQIYRVPPPQNARIVRTHLKSSDNRARQNKSRCLSRSWCGLLLALGIVAAAFAAVYVVLDGAENPQFSLVRVVAAAPPPSSRKLSKPPKFEISLKARNPNGRIGIWYEEDADATATLSLKKQNFASGRFPGGFYQETMNTTVVHFAAVGRVAATLPPEVQSSSTDRNSTAKVAGMVLAVDVPIRMAAGGLRGWKMDVRVHCTFSVSTMTSSGRVSSQDCRTTR